MLRRSSASGRGAAGSSEGGAELRDHRIEEEEDHRIEDEKDDHRMKRRRRRTTA